MLIIAAALAEELRAGLDLCTSRTRSETGHNRLLSAEFRGRRLGFLKTGAGPRRAAGKLGGALAVCRPDRILLIGYAGALEPELKIGDLVVLQRASVFGENPHQRRALDDLDLTGHYDLQWSPELVDLAQAAGIRTFCGSGLTSPFIIGDPAQKRILHRRFQALTIDMETAVLARVAQAAGIPIACVRAISDEANDEVLSPFRYDPDSSTVGRAMRAIRAGNWGDRFNSWRRNAARARDSLRRFLRCCLETWSSGDTSSSWLDKA